MDIGLIGLGLMGTSLHARLALAGFPVVGFDVEADRRTEHTARGGTAAASVAEVVERCELVVLSLPNSDIGREVCLGSEGVAAHARDGLLVIDTTTARPSDTIEIASKLAAANVAFLDATLSGNAAQAAAGDLVAMVGGSSDDLDRARPVLEAFTRSVHHLGPVGSGARAKLIVNLVLGVHRLALAEGLVMGEQAGMDLSVLLDVFKDGAAYSRAMDLWGDRMVAGDHEPPASRIRQSHKDFRLILEQGQEVASPTMLASVVRQVLQHGELTGLADADNSAVVEVLRRMAGIGRVD